MQHARTDPSVEQVVAEFDEIIIALRLREVPREPEDVPEFKM